MGTQFTKENKKQCICMMEQCSYYNKRHLKNTKIYLSLYFCTSVKFISKKGKSTNTNQNSDN